MTFVVQAICFLSHNAPTNLATPQVLQDSDECASGTTVEGLGQRSLSQFVAVCGGLVHPQDRLLWVWQSSFTIAKQVGQFVLGFGVIFLRGGFNQFESLGRSTGRSCNPRR